MFNIFKRKTKFQKLQKQFDDHMKEWKSTPSGNKVKFNKKLIKAKMLLSKMEASIQN